MFKKKIKQSIKATIFSTINNAVHFQKQFYEKQNIFCHIFNVEKKKQSKPN